MDCQHIITQVYKEVKQVENLGQVATYIPLLGNVDPDKFGICLTTIEGEQFFAGDYQESFSIQSIAKVLSLSMAFDLLKDQIWTRVGVEPSGTAFNSLVQLEVESGIPRNPLINAGAIVICDILCTHLKEPKKELIQFIRQAAQKESIDYDEEIAASEKSSGYRNRALINLMKSFNNIENDIEQVLDLYFHLSSIKMSCTELSRTFLYLANKGKLIDQDITIVSSRKAKRINAIMETCGFYDEAGEFAFRVGLPGKSGVGGGIVAILPGEYAIVVWSPRLNTKGNSYRGLQFLESFTTQTEGSIF
ncbi:UNVERIFIED_CONTAM: hypothetical protein GTU68_055162 [Idotea baltica]|nr:hypothetical protein [Idotea baltica]